MSDMYERVLLIDDDDIVNDLNRIAIRRFIRPMILKTVAFDKPEAGLDFIRDSPPDERVATVLFLDINMPLMNGWAFLEEMSRLPPAAISHITTYVLSSSIDIADMRKAGANPLVKGFLSKPLSSHLSSLFGYMKSIADSVQDAPASIKPLP